MAAASTPVTQPRLSFEEMKLDAQRGLVAHQRAVMGNNIANFRSALIRDVYNPSTGGVGVASYDHPGFDNVATQPVVQVPVTQPVTQVPVAVSSPAPKAVPSPARKAASVRSNQEVVAEANAANQAKWVKEPQAVTVQQRAEPQYPTEIINQQAAAQGGWGYNQGATDRMHQQWLNNELPEGAIPTAVYDGPPEGLAAKVAGWFR